MRTLTPLATCSTIAERLVVGDPRRLQPRFIGPGCMTIADCSSPHTGDVCFGAVSTHGPKGKSARHAFTLHPAS